MHIGTMPVWVERHLDSDNWSKIEIESKRLEAGGPHGSRGSAGRLLGPCRDHKTLWNLVEGKYFVQLFENDAAGYRKVRLVLA